MKNIADLREIYNNHTDLNHKAEQIYEIFKNCSHFYVGISQPIKTEKHTFAFFEIAPIAPLLHIWVNYIDDKGERFNSPLLRVPLDFLLKSKEDLLKIKEENERQI